MAGSNNEVYKYVAPILPSQLIDSSIFILVITERKFVIMGVDPINQFYTMIQIITPSRHIVVSPDFLNRIFFIMGNILSFKLNSPQTMKTVFLNTDEIILTNMIYRGQNMIVIESKSQIGCRILLDRKDLLTLQHLEWSIFETIERKTNFVRPKVIQQFDRITAYFTNNFQNQASTNLEKMIAIIKNDHDDKTVQPISKSATRFISQIKLLANGQIAEHWMQQMENKNIKRSHKKKKKV